MNAQTFRSFVKEAMALQTEDRDTPPDFLVTKAAVARKLGIEKRATLLSGLKPALGRAGGWVAKHKDPIVHGTELAGLGVLAKPSVDELRNPQTNPHEKKKAKYELAGLGMLAAPSAAHLGAHLLGRH